MKLAVAKTSSTPILPMDNAPTIAMGDTMMSLLTMRKVTTTLTMSTLSVVVIVAL